MSSRPRIGRATARRACVDPTGRRRLDLLVPPAGSVRAVDDAVVAFRRKLLNDDEEIVLDLNPHWWYMVPRSVALFAAMVLGILSLTTGNGIVQIIAGLVILGALAWWGQQFASWRTINFVVTTDRLIYRNGVLAKSGIEIPLDRVNNVLFNQSIFERLLGAGDLVIESAGESGRQAFSDVRKPSAVQNEIYRQVEANENRKFDRIANAQATFVENARTATPSSASVADELAKLADLRASGVLSEAEFQAQKARLLGS